MTSRRRCPVLALASVGVLGAVALTSCGVPSGDSTFEQIPSEEIPFGLDQTSTTTTSTTTTTTTIVDPPPTSTSTTVPARTAPVELYFLIRGRLQPEIRDLPAGISAYQVADILEEGPTPGFALDTLIEDGLIVSTSEAGGVLTVDLDSDTFDRINTTQQTEAIAQIVLTMVRSVLGIGQVNFTLGGEPIAVKMGNSLLSEVGQPLSFDDYANLLRTAPVTTTSTTSTTTTSIEPTATVAPGG